MAERNRKVDLEKLSDEDVANVEQVLSKKLTEIVNEAVAKANKYANIYGIRCKMAFELSPMTETEKSESLNRELEALGEGTNG